MSSAMPMRGLPSGERLPEGTYVELVRSIFATLMPTAIMGILFISAAMFVTQRINDTPLTILAILGSVLSMARVAILLTHERTISAVGLTAGVAATAEYRFAAAYLSFALVLGMFGARALTLADPDVHIIVIALLVGYAAGVASGVSLRPWIAIPSVIFAITPSVVVASLGQSTAFMLLGFILAMFMAGGLGSMAARYRSESEKITMRRMLGSLARQDHLTGVANRLGISERFAEATSQATDCLVGIHCLDLDRFKLVNDQYGHPTGDELLKAVCARLQRVLREGDIAARLGGDEFAIIQTHMRRPEEAELMARRIARLVSEPYSISDRLISIGASIGYTVSRHCSDELEDLISQADQALYRAKAAGGGVAAFEHVERSHDDTLVFSRFA